MKNIMFIAVFTAVAITIVSCEKESLESATVKTAKSNIANRLIQVSDTLSIQNTITVEGPGDDLVPIKPPKP